MTIFEEKYAYAHAHDLPGFPDGHKCRRMHGHLNEVTIVLRVDDGPNGYAFDHSLIDGVAARILSSLDHRYINDVEGLEDGLAETQLAWLVAKFAPVLLDHLGAVLIEVHLDEWSSGSTFRKVKHRKSWRLA